MITYSVISDPGDRQVNEDSLRVFWKDSRFCAALADGLGGHGCGEVASRLVTDCTIEIFENNAGVSEDIIRRCFEESQERLMKEQALQRKESAMKTTLCILMMDENKLIWGHIGDSRIYHFENGELAGRTADHSVPQMLMAAGEITEQQIRRHPDRNRLLRVMGIEWPRPQYVLSAAYPYEPGHAFLICSDGFWDWIDESEMAVCLRKARTVSEWQESMKRIVQKNGQGQDMDNYSAICVWT